MPDYIEYHDEYDQLAAEIEAEMAAWHEMFDRTPFFVRCKVCSAPDLAPEKTLRERGWALSGQGEFCPSH
jgi:hypothetical protein